MDKVVIDILCELDAFGGKSYLIGGAVRDYLLGLETYDYDIATSLLPDDILKIFKDYKCNDKYKKFGNVIVTYQNIHFEITTLRKEVMYSDNRHPSDICFTDSLEEDLKRRDFTVNAIAMDKDLKIYDFYNSCDDLKNNILKMIGNPLQRISEDYLRILRALRFVSKYNFTVDDELHKVLINDDVVSNVVNLPKERISGELLEIINGKYFNKIINDYSNILKNILKVFRNIENISKYDFSNISFDGAIGAESLDFKLALIYYENEPFLEELNLINVCNKKVNLLRKWILGVKILKNTPKKDINLVIFKKLSIFTDRNTLLNILYLYKIIYKEDLDYLNNETLFISDIKIKGDEIINLGIKKGVEIRNLLNELLEKIILKELNNNNDELKKYISCNYK